MNCPVCKQPQFELKHSVKCGCGFRLKHKKETQPKKGPINLKVSSM